MVSSQKNCCAFAGPTFALAAALASGMENWVGYDRSFTSASASSDPYPLLAAPAFITVLSVLR